VNQTEKEKKSFFSKEFTKYDYLTAAGLVIVLLGSSFIRVALPIIDESYSVVFNIVIGVALGLVLAFNRRKSNKP